MGGREEKKGGSCCSKVDLAVVKLPRTFAAANVKFSLENARFQLKAQGFAELHQSALRSDKYLQLDCASREWGQGQHSDNSATSFPAARNPARIKSVFRQRGGPKINHKETYTVLILRQEYVNKANLFHALSRTDPNNWATGLVTRLR